MNKRIVLIPLFFAISAVLQNNTFAAAAPTTSAPAKAAPAPTPVAQKNTVATTPQVYAPQVSVSQTASDNVILQQARDDNPGRTVIPIYCPKNGQLIGYYTSSGTNTPTGKNTITSQRGNVTGLNDFYTQGGLYQKQRMFLKKYLSAEANDSDINYVYWRQQMDANSSIPPLIYKSVDLPEANLPEPKIKRLERRIADMNDFLAKNCPNCQWEKITKEQYEQTKRVQNEWVKKNYGEGSSEFRKQQVVCDRVTKNYEQVSKVYKR